MKNLLPIFIAGIFCFFSITQADAQLSTPAASPNAKVTYDVGLSEVHIDYNRPSAKGRVIFGDLVAYNEPWRTGANASTKITFSDDIEILGNTLEAGTYSLFTVPGQRQWEVIFHSNLSHNTPGGRDVEEDALVLNVNPNHHENFFMETFTITVNNLRNNGADILLVWENTSISIPFTLDTDSKVSANIDRVLSGPSGRDYFVAANYYLQEGKDLEQALKWMNKSIDMDGERFWVLRTKGLIEMELGKHNDAIKSLNRSSELAREMGNEGYPRMNNATIEEIKASR